MTNEPKGLPTLLPCPFCGEQAVLIPWHRGRSMACCENERCNVGPECSGSTKYAATELWNRRIPPAAVTEASEKIERWSQDESDVFQVVNEGGFPMFVGDQPRDAQDAIVAYNSLATRCELAEKRLEAMQSHWRARATYGFCSKESDDAEDVCRALGVYPMTDILDRLQSGRPSTHWDGCESAHDICAAVMEITRLREEVARLKGEKETRIKYQEIVYDACRAVDRALGLNVRKGEGTIIDALVPGIERVAAPHPSLNAVLEGIAVELARQSAGPTHGSSRVWGIHEGFRLAATLVRSRKGR